MKTCPKCHTDKLETEFYTDKSKPSGLTSHCKPCICAHVKRYNELHPADHSATDQPKKCRTCGETKPPSEFHRDKKLMDGLKQDCRPCLLKRAREYARSNHEKKRIYYQLRMNDPEFVEKTRARAKLNAVKFREKYNARMRLGNAVRKGKIQRQPCEVCGEPMTQAHHDDYSKPFDVRWLCSNHHGVQHRKYE